MTGITLAGIDLAWRGKENQSGVALGRVEGKQLTLSGLTRELFTPDSLAEKLQHCPSLMGIAIDAPLVIHNKTGQRDCETAIGMEYGARYASCHTSNETLYPAADSVSLSNRLANEFGFAHLGCAPGKWQIECYPHPALIEIFELDMRHPYKKGKVADKREGQTKLAQMLLGLRHSPVLKLVIPERHMEPFTASHISSLRGDALKGNEDKLDAIICLYIAGLYSLFPNKKVFGSQDGGYIYVPQKCCK